MWQLRVVSFGQNICVCECMNTERERERVIRIAWKYCIRFKMVRDTVNKNQFYSNHFYFSICKFFLFNDTIVYAHSWGKQFHFNARSFCLRIPMQRIKCFGFHSRFFFFVNWNVFRCEQFSTMETITHLIRDLEYLRIRKYK